MTPQLRDIPPERYARDVLPLTAALWAGRRSFEQYVAQTLEVARSAYGRRHYRTVGLFDGSRLVASFKGYERDVLRGDSLLRAIGFGAVFTPPEYRGRGYASVLLALALDRARAKYDLAYLFSDIRPQFYGELGFREFPSRELTLRADALPARRLDPAQLSDDDWNGVRHAFELCERRRRFGFTRSQSVWEWIRTRVRNGSEHAVGRETNLVVRRRRGISAYVLGVRAPERDAYIVDEYGFTDDAAAAALPALLRAAAGDLRRIVGWLPPRDARQVVPRGTVRKRKRSILMMAPFSSEGELLLNEVSENRSGDFCWATDHI